MFSKNRPRKIRVITNKQSCNIILSKEERSLAKDLDKGLKDGKKI